MREISFEQWHEWIDLEWGSVYLGKNTGELLMMLIDCPIELCLMYLSYINTSTGMPWVCLMYLSYINKWDALARRCHEEHPYLFYKVLSRAMYYVVWKC